MVTINGVDFSSFVDAKTYAITSEDLYRSWTDANGTEHRVVYRKKISGSFKLEFFDYQNYEALLTAVELTDNTYASCMLPVNNVNASSVLYEVFLTVTPAFTKDRLGNILKTVATVKVVER